MILFVSIT